MAENNPIATTSFQRSSIVEMVDEEEEEEEDDEEYLDLVSAEDGLPKNLDVKSPLMENVPKRISLAESRSGNAPRQTSFNPIPHISAANSATGIDRIPCRLVNKDGSYHINHVGAPSASVNYWRNFFLTLIEIRWRWVWLTVFLVYPVTWIAFAIVFYALAYHHGDFVEHPELTGPWIPCVGSVGDFVSMLLFSIESQQTIGYGYRYSTDQCGVMLIFLGAQYIIGSVIMACLSAIVWARILRPRRRGQEIIFSDNACIATNEEGELCFLFRASDTAGSHLVQTLIHLYMAKKWSVPTQSDQMSFRILHMSTGEDTGRDKLIFLWPTIVCHVINKHSPLYGMSKEDFENADLEFIAVAEGIVEATGLTFQVRTSYLNNEVRWGERFQGVNFCGLGKNGEVKINYDDFNNTFATHTPTCSAKLLEARKQRNLHLATSLV